jgi:SHS2 domain-containing protein
VTKAGKRHEFVEHTGDMAILVHAPSLEELYDASAEALFDVILDVACVEPREEVVVVVGGAADPEDLFVRFLSELLFLHDARDWLFRGFKTYSMTAHEVSGSALGERFDPLRHVILRQVKAVTYHHQLLEQNRAGWTARVVLDL